MQQSYLDYAMSVIVGRALPDVRDGMKPVHRRVVYAMYDGGYRPDRAFSKCTRIIGEVMGNYHPHGDSAVYDTLVRMVQDWSLRYPLADGQGNFGSPGNDPAAAHRYTESRMAPIAMEMVRDIDKDTVDFQDNYDGRTQEPVVLPSRFPNLLVNGSAGIAVGMATNIPPHNLREVADGVQWYLDNPGATREELQEALIARIKGPDFPTGAMILGRKGIEEAYRTGRGSITMRSVVNVEEIQGRQCLVVTELPYQVNPDNLALKIAELVKDGKVTGIADIRDETSGRTGQRLVIVLKRDAVAKVVLNNLYKHTQLQENFGANMVALVDGVPRTLSVDQFVKHWVTHQIEVIQRRTAYRLREAEREAHIQRGYVKALDKLDEVIALIRRSPSADEARQGLIELLDVDEVQADAILNLQLRRLAALERQSIEERYAKLMEEIKELQIILGSEDRQRSIVSEELTEIVRKFGDERRTEVSPFDGSVDVEDLIAEEEMVVTITRGGYAKRTRSDQYRAQKRGGKGIRGASLRSDDTVDHFFVTTTHHWLLFFTNLGRVYRAKAYELPEGGRDAKGQHVANMLAFQPGEEIAQVMELKTYQDKPYLVLATKRGLVKKTDLEAYDSNRSGGLIAINLREVEGEDGETRPDELIAARLAGPEDDLMLVSRKGQSLRFHASDDELRSMGRATSGVKGMSFRDDDELLAMDVILAGTAEAAEDADVEVEVDEDAILGDGPYSFVVTAAGYAKRTSASAWSAKHRGGLGVKVATLTEERGDLVGAMLVEDTDEVLVIMESGKVMRSPVSEVPVKGKNTMGVIFAKPGKNDRIIGIARNVERNLGDDEADDEAGEGVVVEGAAVDTTSAATVAVEGAAAEAEAPGADSAE
ncbi:DNA gyrase subunit A [Demequina capsici]|uniref:DNA topoisomerase (ATP-hydrolyzing) n=1 Tax=Demequina capsici TaxID=3075620 RepID=A0AA96JHC5_9MICO|nr:DNA gyrase subunit A [Demequina sp. PMTSA13]WNM28874.1 DNA gyrase subunit A [Demequina sp. PMTSA13]